MSNKVYVIQLSGQGDFHLKVVNKDTWDWINDGGPVPPSVILRYSDEYGMSQAQAKQELSDIDDDSSSPDNDRAIIAPPAKFKGKTFDSYRGTIKELNRFLATHGLEIEEEYEGYIY